MAKTAVTKNAAKTAVNGTPPPEAAAVAEKPKKAKAPEQPRKAAQPMPARFFFVIMGYLVALIALYVAYVTVPDFRDAFPAKLGPLPLGVPFFGALGGTLISLTGVAEHNRNWDDSYRYWHYSRPLVGGVVGSVGALTFFVIVDAATPGSGQAVTPATFYIVAFILGYREETFRGLIRRATDAFFVPGDPKGGKGGPS